MKLNYSFKDDIEPYWFAGGLPFQKMPHNRITVHLAGRSSSCLPAFLKIGHLLIHLRDSPQQSAVTLLLTYQHGTVSPSDSPLPVGEWSPVPGSPIRKKIRVALSPEAVSQIRSVSADDHDYELTLEDVELIDVTKRKNA